MRNINFDMMIAALVMLILNCRGYYKYVMGKQLSEREADRRECMLFPNLYKWVCICSSLLIAVVLFVNVNIRMYNFDDVQCTVIPSVAYGFVTGMNLQLC